MIIFNVGVCIKHGPFPPNDAQMWTLKTEGNEEVAFQDLPTPVRMSLAVYKNPTLLFSSFKRFSGQMGFSETLVSLLVESVSPTRHSDEGKTPY